MTSLDANASWSWSLQNRLDEMRAAVAKLPREQVLECLRACRDLAAELQARHSELAEAELVALEKAMAAEATP